MWWPERPLWAIGHTGPQWTPNRQFHNRNLNETWWWSERPCWTIGHAGPTWVPNRGRKGHFAQLGTQVQNGSPIVISIIERSMKTGGGPERPFGQLGTQVPKWVPKRPQDDPKTSQKSRQNMHDFLIALGLVLDRS